MLGNINSVNLRNYRYYSTKEASFRPQTQIKKNEKKNKSTEIRKLDSVNLKIIETGNAIKKNKCKKREKKKNFF